MFCIGHTQTKVEFDDDIIIVNFQTEDHKCQDLLFCSGKNSNFHPGWQVYNHSFAVLTTVPTQPQNIIMEYRYIKMPYTSNLFAIIL